MIKAGIEIVEEHFSNRLPSMFIKVTDKDFYLPYYNEVWSMLKDNFINEYKYMIETFDCDDYALVLNAWVRQEQYRNKWVNPWAFGEAWGEFGFGKHALNFVATSDKGLRLVEPQSDEMREINEKDIFTFIRL